MTEGAFSLMGAVVCAIVPALLYRQGAIGGGDLKLLAAVGSLLQVTMGVEAQMYAFFAGTLVAPARLAYEGQAPRDAEEHGHARVEHLPPEGEAQAHRPGALRPSASAPPVCRVMLVAYLHRRRRRT